MVGKIIANIKTLDLTKFAEFFENILVEVLEVFLDLAWIDRLALGIDTGGNHVRALVHVRQKKGWRDGRAIVESRTPIAMTTGADLEVEGAVDAVLLSAED